MSHYHVRSWLAIAMGLAASGGALTILLEDAVRSGVWTREHYLMPVMVGVVIAAGHLVATALRNRSLLSALGFAIAFTVGTALTLYSSAGKQAETAQIAIARSESTQAMRRVKEDDLTQARDRLRVAEAMVIQEMTGARCGPRCQDWKIRAAEVTARVEQLETTLRSMEPGKPVASNSRQMARVAAMLGLGTEASVQALLATLEPFAFAMLFEISAIAAFGFGFGHSRLRPSDAHFASGRVQPPANQNVPPSPKKRRGEADEVIVDWVRAYRRKHGRPPQIPELQAQFPGTPKTTAWRRIKQAA